MTISKKHFAILMVLGAILVSSSFNLAYSQTRAEKQKIKEVIKDFTQATNDNFKLVLLQKILDYYKNDDSKYFTAEQLSYISAPEIDQLIGENLVPIDKITDFTKAEKDLSYINLSDRSYTRFVIINDLTNSINCGLNKNKEIYRKKLFQLVLLAKTNDGLPTFLHTYFKAPENINSLNGDWTSKEVEQVISSYEDNPDFFVFEYELLEKELASYKSDGSNSNTERIYNSKEDIKERLFKNVSLLFREYDFLKKLPQSDIDKLLTSVIVLKINKGDLLFNDNILDVFKQSICKNDNTVIDNLVERYNFFIRILQSTINKTYLSDNPVTLTLFTKELLSNAQNPCYISHALSFEFLKRNITEQISKYISNEVFANIICEDALSDLALVEYAVTKNKSLIYNASIADPHLLINNAWGNSAIQSKISTQDINFNSDLKEISSLFKRGRIKDIVIKSRTFDLENYKVVEQCKIKRKWWFPKKFTYVSDIPFKLRNFVKNDGYKSLDVADYSFLERDLRIKYGENRPFFDFVDIINNNSEKCFPIEYNSFIEREYPKNYLETEIRKKIASGFPSDLYSTIGLKLNYQKPLTPKHIFNEVETGIQSSFVPNADKDNFKKYFRDENSLQLDRNFINYKPKELLSNQSNAVDRFYGNTMMYHGNLTVYEKMKSRAEGLPVKPDCHWYEFIWCNGDRNRRFNDERQRHINVAQNKLNENSKNLKALPLFDFLNVKNPTTVEPFYTAFDTVNNFIFCLVKIHDDKGVHILSISKDNLSSASNLKKADIFWTKYDNSYLERYSIDISNLSDHGFEYFAMLSENFLNENMTDNSLVMRLVHNGYTKLNQLYLEHQYLPTSENEYIKNANFSSFLFTKERKLIDLVNQNIPMAVNLQPTPVQKFNFS